MTRLADRARKHLPALVWAGGYDRRWLRDDVPAGVVLAVMLIPQGMAYAALAGMPPVAGLYAAIVPLLVYALLGSSSHLSFGPVALVSLLTAAALDPLARGETARYVALAGVLALLVGGIHLLLAALRAGRIANLVSHPVIVGFTSAAALVIAMSQARDLFGFDAPRSEHFLEAVRVLAAHVGETNPPTLAIGLASIAVMVAGRRLASGVPWPLVVVVAATGAAWALDLETAGVATLGHVPAGLPAPALPVVDPAVLGRLLLPALTIALIGYTESISIAKAIATRSRERVRPNTELGASGVANTAAGLFGGFPVAGSLSRTAATYEAGARTQLAGVVAAGVIALVVVLATGLLAHLPWTVLAAIVIVAVARLVDVRAARETLRASRVDGTVVAVTFLATLGVGVEAGILAGIAVNLAAYLLRRTAPHLPELGRVVGTTLYRSTERFPTVTDTRVAIFRIDAPLDFLTADATATRIAAVIADRPELRAIVLDASALTELDATGIHALRGLVDDLDGAGVTLALATVRGPVRDRLVRAGDWETQIGPRCHTDVDAALAACDVPAEHPLRKPAPAEPRTSVT